MSGFIVFGLLCFAVTGLACFYAYRNGKSVAKEEGRVADDKAEQAALEARYRLRHDADYARRVRKLFTR